MKRYDIYADLSLLAKAFDLTEREVESLINEHWTTYPSLSALECYSIEGSDLE